MPTPVRGTHLLAAATSGRSEDMNWRRGVTWLWILFGALALTEACYTVLGVVGGCVLPLPPYADFIRVCLVAGLFLALWFGWNWPRVILALFAFLFAAWLAVTLLRDTDLRLQAAATGNGPPPSEAIPRIPAVLLSFLYLILAVYLAFGTDVTAFIKHRHEDGHGWVAVLVALLLGVYLAGILAVPDLYADWSRQQQDAAEAFGRDTLRAIAEHWDSATLLARCDERLLERIPTTDQPRLLTIYKPLGPLRSATQESHHANSMFDPLEQRFLVRGDYSAVGQFDHGRDHFFFVLERSLFGPWRVALYIEDGMSMDRATAPVPPPGTGPVPGAAPAAGGSAPSGAGVQPGATASPAPGSAEPRTPVATPAASPAPRAGG
jgi:hypothetical protein